MRKIDYVRALTAFCRQAGAPKNEEVESTREWRESDYAPPGRNTVAGITLHATRLADITSMFSQINKTCLLLINFGSVLIYQKHPNKPVMNIEHGGYEEGPYRSFTGNYTNPEVCLERNYACVFAGVYSCSYWQNTSWDIVIYDALNPKQSLPKPRFDY